MPHADSASARRPAWPALALAATALAVGVGLALAHPVAPRIATLSFVLFALASAHWPCLWTAAVPALLPLALLAPWTGAIAADEFDLLVLATLAGGYASLRKVETSEAPHHKVGMPAVFVVVACAVAWLAGVARVFGEAGAPSDLWLDGYLDAGNTLRIAKSAPWALLLLPLWRGCLVRIGDAAGLRMAMGVAAGFAVAGSAVVIERAAFTGLTNFSTDYRVTGPFWEMHTGGAALDGFVVLAVPWLAWLAVRARTFVGGTAVACLAALACYVTVVTFSRAAYLAVPVALGVFLLSRARQTRRAGTLLRDAIAGIVVMSLVAVGTWLAFRHGGYRTLAAVLGMLAASLALAPALRPVAPCDGVLAVGSAMAAMLIGVALAHGLPKGPYLLFALAFVACCAFAMRQHAMPRRRRSLAAMSLLVFLAASVPMVARHWGGIPAFEDAAIVVAAWLALLVGHALGPTALLPATVRTRAVVFVLASGVAFVVTALTGGAYMSDRLAGARTDLDGRMRHWSDTLGMLDVPVDWLLGHGFGRFPANYLFRVPDGPHPGNHQISGDAGRAWLSLAGPRHSASFGEMLRVGQWITIAPGTQRVTFAIRAPQDALLHVEICDRHLLYNGECAIGKHEVKPAGATWQHVVLHLDARRLPTRRWLLPNPVFFAFAVESERRRVEITDVGISGSDGTQRIANGTFEAGMARWFTISERHHLPWHAKSLPLNVLFEQGLVGLAAFAALVAGALWRVSFGRARCHPLAPALAASIAGFLVVGVFDSLLDVPRVAFLFWLFVLIAVTLPAEPRGGATTAPA